MKSNIRLSDFEIKSITDCFIKVFGENNRLWIFGSRVDPQQKGGDIDLYAEILDLTDESTFMKKISFLGAVKSIIGEQKIDFIIRTQNDPRMPIHDEAKKTGIPLL
jgi:uncharacterized protein